MKTEAQLKLEILKTINYLLATSCGDQIYRGEIKFLFEMLKQEELYKD